MLHNNQPPKILLPFANGGVKNTIPVASQIGATPGAASFTDGFPPLTMTPLASGGIPPSGADFNGIFNQITAIQQWQAAGGFFSYDAAFAAQIGGYPKGAMIAKSDGTGFWINQIDGNSANPEAAGTSGWIDNNTSPTRPPTDNSDANATTAFVQNAVASMGGGSGGGGGGTWAPQTNPAGGLNNYAPLDSPTFTGVPNVPTASATKQAASLAYVQSMIKNPGAVLPGNKYIWTNGSSGNYSNGYQMLPNGFMIQWGATPAVQNPSGDVVYFNIAFPNYCMISVGTAEYTNAIVTVKNPELPTYFTWTALSPGGGAPGMVSMSWIAMGF